VSSRMLCTPRSWSFILKDMPGPSTLLHGFFDMLEARSMCLKLAVVIFAVCDGRRFAKGAFKAWREVGFKTRWGAATRKSIYCLSSMMSWSGNSRRGNSTRGVTEQLI
jgi:hypothetical protein